MDQVQAVSSRRMLLWSIGVIVGVCLLPLFVHTETPKLTPEPKSTHSALATHHWFSSAQVPVYFLQAPGSTFLDIQLKFDTGPELDGSKPGLACLVSQLIGKETEARTSSDIVTQFEEHGGIFHSSCQLNTITLSLRTPGQIEHMQPNLALLQEIIGWPSFSHELFHHIKNKTLCELHHKDLQPEYVAYRRLRESIYNRHPYRFPKEGTFRSLQTIDHEEAIAFSKQYLVAGTMTIHLIGNLSIDQATSISELFSQTLPCGDTASPMQEPPPRDRSILRHIAQDSERSVTLIGTLGVPNHTPDYPVFFLTSQLLKYLVELPYCHNRGITCELISDDFLYIKLKSETEQANQGVSLVLVALEELITEGPTAEQLSFIKKSATAELEQALRHPRNLWRKLQQLNAKPALASEPVIEKIENIITSLNKVTRDDVKKMLERLLAPNRRVTIMSGMNFTGIHNH